MWKMWASTEPLPNHPELHAKAQVHWGKLISLNHQVASTKYKTRYLHIEKRLQNKQRWVNCYTYFKIVVYFPQYLSLH